MWPRLLAQLVELLPHATRLMPLADHYFTTRRDADKSQAAALEAMSGSVRQEIGHVSNAFGSIARQLAEQRQQIAALEDALEAAERHRIAQTRQLEWITGDLNSMRLWLKFGMSTVIILLVALSALTVQLYRLR